jgi:hypothetical protein
MVHDAILLPAEGNTMFAHIGTTFIHSYIILTTDHSCIYYITYVHIIIAFSDPNTVHSKTVLQKSMPVHSVLSNDFTSDYQTSQNMHSFGIVALWLLR